jgi:Ca-activated chloride channel family protein
MKARSFEYQLRQAVPPAPDMEARLRARRAALAEFAKVNGERDALAAAPSVAVSAESAESPSEAAEPTATHAAGAESRGRAAWSGGRAAEHGHAVSEPGRPATEPRRKRESLWSLGWPLKGAWLGGMATACVIVVGVSVVWLMPPRDREINFNVSLSTKSEVPPVPETASSQSAGSGAGSGASSGTGANAQSTVTSSAPTDANAAALGDASRAGQAEAAVRTGGGGGVAPGQVDAAAQIGGTAATQKPSGAAASTDVDVVAPTRRGPNAVARPEAAATTAAATSAAAATTAAATSAAAATTAAATSATAATTAAATSATAATTAAATSAAAATTAAATSAAAATTAAATSAATAPAEADNSPPPQEPVLTADERRQLAMKSEWHGRRLEEAAPATDTTDRPVPATPKVAPPAAGNAGAPAAVAGQLEAQEVQAVTVTGSRVARNQTYNSPSAVVASENRLDEVVVTEARRKRGFFSRKASVPAPAPPTAERDEGRDKFQHFETNPVKRVADDPVSTFSVDVDTAAYSFVRRKLNEGVLPQMDAVRVEEMINYFDYAWPTSDSRDEPFKPTVTVSDSPWGKGKKLIHIGIKGYALPANQQPDVNLVLLLDVSGSMASPDKLPLAQRSMALLLDSLRPTDTVAIVVYAGAAGQVLAPTPVSEKETILRAISALEPGGSTAGAEGIRLAYALAEKSFRKGGVNRILLATDGDFNVGITDQNELKSFVAREREKGVYLSVLGFGEGNYRDEMAQTLAQNGNGVAAYIDSLNEAKKVLVQEATSSLFPIAKDVKLQVEFNPATVAEYRLVGYETRALNREDFNNDKVDAGDVGSGHTVTAIYEITPVGSDATLIDESRYGARNVKGPSHGKANEYGFLKIRYKLPNGFRSRLLEQPIRMDAGVPAALRDDVSFSTAVAGFGQLLRGSQYVGGFSFEDVIKQAQAGVGADPYGYRAEFVRLVSQAQHARGL